MKETTPLRSERDYPRARKGSVDVVKGHSPTTLLIIYEVHLLITFRSAEPEDFHLDRNRQETLRNFSVLSMHTRRLVETEIEHGLLAHLRSFVIFSTSVVRENATRFRGCYSRVEGIIESLRRVIQ